MHTSPSPPGHPERGGGRGDAPQAGQKHARNSPEALAARYLAGLTLRQIGAELGICHQTVRYHMRKLRGYRAMVTRMLLARVRAAREGYAITRTRENRRRMKHTVAMLRRNRPEILARLIDGGRPKSCPECGKPVIARPLANLWAWECGYCGCQDIVRRRRIESSLRG